MGLGIGVHQSSNQPRKSERPGSASKSTLKFLQKGGKKIVKKNFMDEFLKLGQNLSDNLSPAKSSKKRLFTDEKKKAKLFNFQDKNVEVNNFFFLFFSFLINFF